MLGSREQHLGLGFKKLFLSDSDVSLKVKGLLNTVTARCELQGALSKVQQGGGGLCSARSRVWVWVFMRQGGTRANAL